MFRMRSSAASTAALAPFAAAVLACCAHAETDDVEPGRMPPQDEPIAAAERDDASAGAQPVTPQRGLVVTSFECTTEGSCYVAGTFVDTRRVGAFTLESRGSTDVFLARTRDRYDEAAGVASLRDPGEVVWARSIGSSLPETAPRLTVQTDVATVTLLGTTRGAVDCGRGPMTRWSDEGFYVCVFAQRDGALMAGGTFPRADVR
jgi:hypothetical protein